MAFNRSSLLLKGFCSNDVPVLVRLYKVYVRPLLESIRHTNGIVIVLIQCQENTLDHSPNVPEALCIGTSLVAMMDLSR